LTGEVVRCSSPNSNPLSKNLTPTDLRKKAKKMGWAVNVNNSDPYKIEINKDKAKVG